MKYNYLGINIAYYIMDSRTYVLEHLSSVHKILLRNYGEKFGSPLFKMSNSNVFIYDYRCGGGGLAMGYRDQIGIAHFCPSPTLRKPFE